MRQKVLFISISAPPKNAPESLQVAKYLKYLSKEFDITLVTSKNQGGWRPIDNSLMSYLEDISEIIEVPLWHNRFLFFLLRKVIPVFLNLPDSDFSFSYKWRSVLKRLKNSPDLIYSRSTPISSHILALKLKKNFKKVPWIMHLSDPWVDNPYSELKGLALHYNAKMEQECFARANRVTVTSMRAFNFYVAKYPMFKNKFALSYNVYDDLGLPRPDILFDRPFTLVHTGRLYGSRTCVHFLEAVKLFLKSTPLTHGKCRIIFAGFADDSNVRALREFGEIVEYQENLSFDDSISLQRSAHILISIDANEEREQFKLFFPSKILDYILSGRRILALTPADSTTQEVLKKGYGDSFQHKATEEIASFLGEAYKAYLKKDKHFFTVNDPPPEYSASYNVKILKELFDQKI